METESVKAKPFLKWAGGKGQLLTEIQKYYPFEDKKITKYIKSIWNKMMKVKLMLKSLQGS